MLKKFVLFFIVATMILATIPFVRAADEISVLLNGEKVVFDVQPIIIDGRTLVPVRKISEMLGYNVDWNPETRSVSIFDYNSYLLMQIDNKSILKNLIPANVDVPPMIVGGRTLVPLRLVSESFGATVDWKSETKTVIITLSTKTPATLNLTTDYTTNSIAKFKIKNIDDSQSQNYEGFPVVEGGAMPTTTAIKPNSENMPFFLVAYDTNIAGKYDIKKARETAFARNVPPLESTTIVKTIEDTIDTANNSFTYSFSIQQNVPGQPPLIIISKISGRIFNGNYYEIGVFGPDAVLNQFGQVINDWANSFEIIQ